MRLLLLIIQFPPDVNSTGLLMAQVFEGLKDQGHEVSVITSFPHYAGFKIAREYQNKLAERANYKGMDVLRLPVYASGNKQRMSQRLLSYLSFSMLGTIAGLLKREHFDLIFCTNGSFFTGIAAHVIGKIKEIPFIYNVQDLYPETPVRAGQLTNRRAIAMLERMERYMYQRAAGVSVITDSFRDNIVSKGIPADKISVIPNFVDTDFIRPLPKVNPLSERLGLQDKFVITHAGNLGYVYDLETMLEAARLLERQNEICFLIVGEGVAKAGLERKSESLGLHNVRFLPFLPYEELPWLRAASDVQVSLYKRGSGYYSMPSKVYEIMASARPVLAAADHDTDVWQLVERTRCGLSVEPGNTQALAESVLTLYRSPDLREELGANGRRHAQARYSKSVVISLYQDLFRNVISKGKALPQVEVHQHADASDNALTQPRRRT